MRNKPTMNRAIQQLKDARLQPPDDLNDEQKRIWRETVNALPSDWFANEHISMLKLYVGHIDRAGKLEAALNRLDPVDNLADYEKLTKLAGLESAKALSLARAMRLTQQTRIQPLTAGNRSTAAAQVASQRFGNDPHDDLLAI